MSDETPSPETPAPKVRRVSNPRPKKAAKAASKKAAAAESPVESPAEVKEAVAAIEPAAAPKPPVSEPVAEPVERESAERESASSGWPEAETVSSSSEGGSSEGKRKRRRKKKGNKNHNVAPADEAGAQQQPVQSQPQPARQADQPRPQQQQQHPQQQSRSQIDPGTLAKRAWKIFLAEVSEEGVSLISDHDARELSKRCFRLAELFLEEESRRVR